MEETENQAQIPDSANQAVDNHEKTPQDSFAELRKAKDDLERQLWQANKEKEMYEKQMQMQREQMYKPQTPPEEDFDYRSLEHEEFPDGKKLVKAFNQFNKQLSQKDKALAESNQKLAALELMQQLPDFKDVVTAENIEKYIKSDEDHLDSMQHAANPLRKAYNLIKKDSRFIADNQSREQKAKPISQELARIADKEGKPKTGSIGVRSESISAAASMSNSQMSRQQKAALWAETQSLANKPASRR